MTQPILDAPVSPLRQRLIDDMNLRRFSHETQRNYLRDIGRLAAFLRRSPDTTAAEDLRRFQIEQQEDGVPVPTMNSIESALRFFDNAVPKASSTCSSESGYDDGPKRPVPRHGKTCSYIKMFYNPRRKHVRNGMLSPVKFERQQEMRTEGV